MITGTNHFPSEAAAVRYYTPYEDNPKEAVKRLLKEKAIVIGRPKIKDGERVFLKEERYYIEKSIIIPSLGNTSEEVFNAAIEYPTAGYSIVFQTVFDGIFALHNGNRIHRMIWQGNIPLIDNEVSPEWIQQLIKKGEVSIYVQSPGAKPHYKKELHRATGRVLLK